MMVPENWPVILNDIVDHVYELHRKQQKDYVAELFNVQTSNHQSETHYGTGELGQMQEWTAAGNQVPYEDIDPNYEKTYTHKKYALGFQVQKELVEDERYGVIKKKPRKLARSEWYTRQVLGMSVFNNAFLDGYAGPDGKALCSTAHPAGPSNTGTTFSNRGTAALTAPALEAARVAATGGSTAWRDDKGNLIVLDFNTLLVPPALNQMAKVIAGSEGEPDTSDNNINIWRGEVNVIVCPFLTSSTAWFLMDDERAKDLLNWFDRKKGSLEYGGYDFNRDTAQWAVKNRLSYGYDHWSFVYGSTGTG